MTMRGCSASLRPGRRGLRRGPQGRNGNSTTEYTGRHFTQLSVHVRVANRGEMSRRRYRTRALRVRGTTGRSAGFFGFGPRIVAVEAGTLETYANGAKDSAKGAIAYRAVNK